MISVHVDVDIRDFFLPHVSGRGRQRGRIYPRNFTPYWAGVGRDRGGGEEEREREVVGKLESNNNVTEPGLVVVRSVECISSVQ